ncbi:glycerol-3-phosphate dehydrogenase/oxidase [Inhella gelatinilytica]|uniref:Glycerol-3-phosphate dehydrogenase n=1 Tax=Inhella gelatinilytica TaxID=2795030 RepID=A0A931NAQ2_9BURK|nr:glycerol-3-phosphate dehydrogenase/oxidase [Inhella gelatinilytica]MBH9552723.1 glycerol-3-phosphate dehydrogenase/oxidase [Inhella gelatinilytica]
MKTRSERLQALCDAPPLDLVVVGGGATGAGVALDAAARGYAVALLEADDFAKGTSSRATKLVHGGVRYLAQGQLGLVREALRERRTLLANAPHLASPLRFVLPAYRPWQVPFFGLGLMAYDLLAGRSALGRTRWLGRTATQKALPGVNPNGLWGGIQYWDAQFDDARLALALARSAERAGALVLNHCPVEGLRWQADKVAGVVAVEAETGSRLTLNTRCVINATGVWVDDLRERDHQGRPPEPLVTVSQGVHLVVDRQFLPSEQALLVPKTEDGRVLFAVPWMGRVILGTTDTPRRDKPLEPQAFDEEIEFILREAGRVLVHPPGRSDVLSVWAGLRPLARPNSGPGNPTGTGGISREHHIEVRPSGLVSVTGGKWTTYRAMAEDVLSACMAGGWLDRRPGGVTAQWPLVGAQPLQRPLHQIQGLARYGSEIEQVQSLPGADRWLHPELSEAMVRFAARWEMARTVEDVLARRVRLLFLDARAALAVAEPVADLLREETGVDPQLDAFRALAHGYCLTDTVAPE